MRSRKRRRALEAIARVVAAAPAARRGALAPLCAAAASRARAVAADGAAAEAFRALADALAGSSWDGDAAPVSGSALVPIHMNRRPAGIFQTAEDGERRRFGGNLGARGDPRDLARRRAARRGVRRGGSRGERRGVPPGARGDGGVRRRRAGASPRRRRGCRARRGRAKLRRGDGAPPRGEAGAHGETAVGDVSFRVAAAVFVGARPDATYPRDADAGTAVASALARLATRRAYRAQSDTRDLLVAEQNARARDVAVPLAAAHALASLVLKRGGSGALGAEGGSAAATAAGVASPESSLCRSIGARAAGGVLRALAARGDPAEPAGAPPGGGARAR